MSVDLCRDVAVIDLEIDDEIDLENDEYGDNEQALYGFAIVTDTYDWRDDDGYLWITLYTTQGNYNFPAGHLVKMKVQE